MYAVYDFLDCAAAASVGRTPGQIGLVCPKTPTLAVHSSEIRRAPSMVHRWITPGPLYMPGPPKKLPVEDVQLWKLRTRIGGRNFWVCHSFYGYHDRFLKTHPDRFAQGYTGQPLQTCDTYPDFIRAGRPGRRDYFDGEGINSGATAVGDVSAGSDGQHERGQASPLSGRVEQGGKKTSSSTTARRATTSSVL